MFGAVSESVGNCEHVDVAIERVKKVPFEEIYDVDKTMMFQSDLEKKLKKGFDKMKNKINFIKNLKSKSKIVEAKDDVQARIRKVLDSPVVK